MNDIDENKAPLIEHLIELRKRLLICIVGLIIAGGVCYYFANDLLGFLVEPLKKGFGKETGRLVYTKLYEAFFVEQKVAMVGAFFLSFPIIANHLLAFVAPGRYTK